MALRDWVLKWGRAFSVAWPGVLALLIGSVGLATGAEPEPLVLTTLIALQIVWLALWFGTPVAAKAVGRALGRRAD